MKTGKNLLAYGILAGLLLGIPAVNAAPPDGPQMGAVEEIAQGTTEVRVVEQPGPEGAAGGDHHWHHHPGMMLSDDQLEKMSALKDAFMSATASERTQLHLLHRQMQDLMTRPTVDRAAVVALQAKMNALRDDLSTKAINYKLDKLALLTPEQRHEMRHHELLRNVFGHMGGMHGHGFGGGPEHVRVFKGGPGHGPGGCPGGECH